MQIKFEVSQSRSEFFASKDFFSVKQFSSIVKTRLSKTEFYLPFSVSRRTFWGAQWRSG
jgi:hypothetical protein